MKNFKMFLLFLAGSFVLIGCSNNDNKKTTNTQHVQAEQKMAPQEQKQEMPKMQENVKKEESKNSTSQMVQEATKKANEIKDNAIKTAKESTKKVIEATKEAVKQAGDNEMVKSVAKKIEDSTKAITAALPTVASDEKTKSEEKPKADNSKAQKLFVKCAGCHGDKAQNKALGVSKVIAGWDVKRLEDAIKGYKAGTYGGPMKGVMKSQVVNLSDDDIKALAVYISKLK